MAGVDVGGDESVMWRAQGDNVRKDQSLKHEKLGDFGWLHNGVDEAEGDFTINIKIPSDPQGLYRRMRDAITAAENDPFCTAVTFTLPIEFGQHKQIQISWISDLSNPHGAHKSAAFLKSATSARKKVSRQAAVRKAKKKTSSKSMKKKTSKKR